MIAERNQSVRFRFSPTHLNLSAAVLSRKNDIAFFITGRENIHMKKIVTKVIVDENQRGLYFKNGKFMGVLEPGRYHIWGDREIVTMSLYGEILCHKATADTLLANIDFAARVLVVDVEDHAMALLYRNGNFVTALSAGRHVYWNEDRAYAVRMIDRTDPMVPEDLPASVLQRLIVNHKACRAEEVTEYQKGLLFVNRQYVRMLEPGVYCFWNNGMSVQVRTVDTRLLQLDITGQEMLTRDKVTIRVNLVCHYRIREYEKVLLEVDDYEEQLHLAAQMALREYVGRCTLDEILENKDKMGAYLLETLKGKEEVLYLTVTDAGVKDIILPGEIREIMNTVLVAEKRAQANVITRREEVASTRSLLNTAKLMDENQTLYKLKELEYLEKICEHVGSIHLSGGDVLGQLSALLKGNAS